MSDEYPKMLFKAGTECRVWNAHDVDTLIVGGEEEELAAKLEGWSESPAPPSPLDHDKDGHLGGSLPRRGRPPKEKVTGDE